MNGIRVVRSPRDSPVRAKKKTKGALLVFMGQWAVEAEEEEDEVRQRKDEKV